MELELDILATEPHFRDHLRPVHEALLAAGVKASWHESTDTLTQRKATGLAAAYGDLEKLRKTGRQVIFAEHGAGQSYAGSNLSHHTSYSGGGHRHGVIAFLTPGQYSTKRNREIHAWTPCYEVGCPKLDAWAGFTLEKYQKPLVVISWHWDCMVTHETRSAFYEYRQAVVEVSKGAEFDLAVHSHPRIAKQVKAWAESVGIEWIETFDEVLKRANVYAVDNSSTLFEFAATGRPVAVLNSRHYRRHVDHGLRFWREAGIGVNCDKPADLHRCLLTALSDPLEYRTAREASVRRVYGAPLGQATSLAVAAIIEIISEERVIVSQHRVRARSSAIGYAGAVSKGWVIDLYPSHVVVTDNQGREFTRDYAPKGNCDPEYRAREMVGTGVYDPIAVPRTAPLGTVSTPPRPSENKIAPPPQEHKQTPPHAVGADAKPPHLADEAEDALDEEALDEAILECVRQGQGKTATKKELGATEAFTQNQVVEAWNRLQENGDIVEGDKPGTYKVAE